MYQGVGLAKINLSLGLTGRRADGYHELASVMQTVSLGDVVEVERTSQECGIELACDCPGLALDGSNLAWRAAALLLEEFKPGGGVRIRLHKEIPLGGGLAGGSTDAAQVLLGVNELFGLGLAPAELAAYAVRLGADVPFCLTGGTQLARGIGEELERLPDCPELRLVLVNPGFGVDTGAVYRQYDRMPEQAADAAARSEEMVAMMREALAAGDPAMIRRCLYNGLEPAAFALFPELAAIRTELAGLGLAALLCGSGATVMGIAADKKRAAVAADALAGKYPFVCAVTTRG